ncbi:hypothetical protein J6590_087968 [Homalodisca vitripennis]|nr:hypothetical protein J6590_087968 [Homalodisca vitripennis]
MTKHLGEPPNKEHGVRLRERTRTYTSQVKSSRCDCEGVDPPHLSRPLPVRLLPCVSRVKALVAFATFEVVVDVISHPWEDAVGGPPGREAHGCDPTARCQAFYEAPDGRDVGRRPDYGVPQEPGRPSGPPETHALDSEQLPPCGLAANRGSSTRNTMISQKQDKDQDLQG